MIRFQNFFEVEAGHSIGRVVTRWVDFLRTTKRWCCFGGVRVSMPTRGDVGVDRGGVQRRLLAMPPASFLRYIVFLVTVNLLHHLRHKR